MRCIVNAGAFGAFPRSGKLVNHFVLLLDPRIPPSHVEDPDADGQKGQNTADDKVNPPQIRH